MKLQTSLNPLSYRRSPWDDYCRRLALRRSLQPLVQMLGIIIGLGVVAVGINFCVGVLFIGLGV